MNKIHKNITAIEQKFDSFKAAYQLYNQPIPISQVAQAITYRVILEQNVQNYLKHVHSDPDIASRQKVNEKWYELDFSQMVAFLDQVIFHRNEGKQAQSPSKSNSTKSPKKRKIKAPTSQAHQNPYIPPKITLPIKNPIPKRPNSGLKDRLQNKINLPNVVKQSQQEGYYSSLLLNKSKSLKEPQVSSPTSNSKKKQIISDLPADFQSLSPKQRYSILSKKYGKDKNILQKKFDSIYKHYRKEMFIPFESFQINNDLLMDLRIFLKYYREFQVSKNFKTNEAIQHFKQIALNGLWLDDKQFMEMHYKLIELIQIDENLSEIENQPVNDQANVDKANEMKMQISKKIKNLVQNILKVKELSDIVSQDKIKQIFNNKESSGAIKKIVEAHSGLTKDDVMLKLQQRVQFRKLRKSVLLENFNQERFGKLGAMNPLVSKALQDPTQRLSPTKMSIYDELEMPKLRSRQLKKSSVYSSLELMNMQDEKEKLKKLVNQRENEQYLEAFFKKEKQNFSLHRSKSVALSKNPAQNEESTNGFTVNSTKSIKQLIKGSVFQRNLSLPRMKFN